MRWADHYRQILSLFRGGFFVATFAATTFALAASGFLFDAVLTEAQKSRAGEFARAILSYWQWFLIAFLCSVILALYLRIFPRLSIQFNEDDQWYQTVENGVRKFRVDLVNYGPFQTDISFRLDRIQLQDGSYHPTPRKGFQREANVGPMPLSPDSPKAGYLVQLDEGTPTSEIEVLTTSDLTDGYQPQPIRLPRAAYKLHVSLNPRDGQPYRSVFAVSVEGDNRLRVRQLPT